MVRPRAEIAKISPVARVQNCDVPAPSVAGPVAQLDEPAGPPVPASVTMSPAGDSTRCLGVLSPLCITASCTPAGTALATAAPADVLSHAASTATAVVAVLRIMVPFAPGLHDLNCRRAPSVDPASRMRPKTGAEVRVICAA